MAEPGTGRSRGRARGRAQPPPIPQQVASPIDMPSSTTAEQRSIQSLSGDDGGNGL